METLSVIIQVTSFKTTGKRVFKMSPIHHHFELLGWSEKKVVIVFSVVSFLLSAVAVVLFELLRRGIMSSFLLKKKITPIQSLKHGDGFDFKTSQLI